MTLEGKKTPRESTSKSDLQPPKAKKLSIRTTSHFIFQALVIFYFQSELGVGLTACTHLTPSVHQALCPRPARRPLHLHIHDCNKALDKARPHLDRCTTQRQQTSEVALKEMDPLTEAQKHAELRLGSLVDSAKRPETIGKGTEKGEEPAGFPTKPEYCQEGRQEISAEQQTDLGPSPIGSGDSVKRRTGIGHAGPWIESEGLAVRKKISLCDRDNIISTGSDQNKRGGLTVDLEQHADRL